VTFQVAYEWLVWVMAVIGWWAPGIVGIATLWLSVFFAVWSGGLLRGVGQARLANYFEYTVVHVAWVGMFFLIATLEQMRGEAYAVAILIIKLRLWSSAGDLGMIAGMTALLFVVFTTIGGISDRISEWVGETPTPLMLEMRPRTFIERLAWVSVVSPTAGFCEEVIFRGVLFFFLLDLGADTVIAVALTSLAFGLGHVGYGLTWTVGSTVLGAAAALSVVACGSLWPAIIAHALYDMTVYFIFEDQVPADAGEPAPAPANVLKRLVLPLR
jgi:membrane protease YdiL (CAAX protease family)